MGSPLRYTFHFVALLVWEEGFCYPLTLSFCQLCLTVSFLYIFSYHAYTLRTDDARQVGVRTLIKYFLIHSENIITDIPLQCQEDVLATRNFVIERIKWGYEPLGLCGWQESPGCLCVHLVARHCNPSLLPSPFLILLFPKA